ncbi:TPA: ABC transporter permease, partial [Candidatus Micrarchaeota archaeon]|nr:ABC transporter permease [Candidatus Micrarchaeota archaeon]
MEDMHGFQLVINFLVFPPFFLSGALFPLSGAPVPIRVASLLNPLTYGVDALRLLFLGTSSFSLAFDLAVLSTFFVATTFAAAELFKRIEN